MAGIFSVMERKSWNEARAWMNFCAGVPQSKPDRIPKMLDIWATAEFGERFLCSQAYYQVFFRRGEASPAPAAGWLRSTLVAGRKLPCPN
jgi:hypothetical protein